MRAGSGYTTEASASEAAGSLLSDRSKLPFLWESPTFMSETGPGVEKRPSRMAGTWFHGLAGVKALLSCDVVTRGRGWCTSLCMFSPSCSQSDKLQRGKTEPGGEMERWCLIPSALPLQGFLGTATQREGECTKPLLVSGGLSVCRNVPERLSSPTVSLPSHFC